MPARYCRRAHGARWRSSAPPTCAAIGATRPRPLPRSPRTASLRTGDIGYLDEDGYLFIVDRAKDVIIRGGENVSCQEVEAALYAHPAVAEACVFGLQDERLGETPVAVVHLEQASAMAAATLADFLAVRLARFKRPTRIWHSDAPLPNLGSGKIDKAHLRATYGTREPEAGG